MSWKRWAATITLVAYGGSWAQAPSDDLSPPPMVPATPPPPAPEPGSQLVPPAVPPAVAPVPAAPLGTPPPPGYLPPATQPQAPSGYPYSPYGEPLQPREPPQKLEWGLMISETLFGMLTSAGVTLIPYFLLFRSGQTLGDPTISSVIFILVFSAVPLAVSQTQTSLANGSRFFSTETWPAALTGLAMQAAVLGLYYATGWLPQQNVSGGVPTQSGSEGLLLIGSIALVPLAEMAIINLTKSPKVGRYGALMGFNPREGLSFGVPLVQPTVADTRLGRVVGLNVPLAGLSF